MPPRRTTRLSAASSASSTSTAQSVPPATRTRKQTRLGVASSLQDDDDENNDHQGDDSDDSLLDGEDESEQESTPIPPKRATRTSRSTPIASSSLTTKPPSRKPPVARGKAKAPEPVTSARRSARLSVSPLPEAPPVKATRNGKVQKTKVVDSDEDEDDEMEESVMVASQREDEDDEEQDEDSLAEDPDRTIQPGDDDLVQDVKPTLTSPSKPSFRDQDRPNDSSDEEEDFIEQDLVEQSIRFKKTGSSTPRPLSPTKLQPGLSSPKKPSQETLQSARFASPSDVKTQSLPSPVPVIEQGLKKRLVIRKMALVNFKSYKGRQEIGPFHKSFSAIVGPNGSGKSNTIDAMLFVFGYRASKMRQGKLSELIHNSEGSEDLDSCSVEVWFEEIIDRPGSEAYEVVPGSQLVVARTAFRNNSSKYTINDKASTFSEVTTLLKSRGIDLDHKRFLILQGEVESIAQMKPKGATEHEDGLLEYLEDIIGTSKYKLPIEEAQVRVDELNEARGERLGRLKLVEREKSGLEGKKQEAEDYLRDTNELTRKKSLLYQFHMYTLKNNIEITNKTMEKFQAKLAKEQEKNAGTIQDIDNLQKAFNEKLEAYEEVKHHVDVLVKEAKRFEKEELSLGEKRKHLITKQKKLKKAITDDTHAKNEATYGAKSQAEEIDKMRNQVDELEHRLVKEEADLEEVRDSLKDKTDQFTTKIEVCQRELEPWMAKINERQSAVDVAESEKKVLAGKVVAGEKALEDAHRSLEELVQSVQSKREERKALAEEKDEMHKQLDTMQKKVQGMVNNSDVLRAKVTAARQKADDAKASLASNKSENAVLSTLTKLKTQGRLKGFHGRLGDLGVIDDKYDVAVTTACGALNSLVVDEVEQGQACIEVLRRGNIGRASIMVLDKLPARNLSPIATPENVPRLFDLIKPKDPRFAQAFYKGVVNTLVAEDLEQAQRIGYGKQRWRVVTLAGQLIDPSGTMSGGGARVQRGGMSSKFVGDKVEPEVIAKYEEEVEQAQQAFTEFQGDRKALEQEVARLNKQIPDIEVAMEKLDLDLNNSDQRIANAKDRLKEVSAQAKPDANDQKRIKTLSSEIVAHEAELKKLRTKASAIEEQIKDLQEKILEVGGVKLRALQSKVGNTKNLIELAGENMTKAEVAQAKAERDSEKLEKTLAGSAEKLEELETELVTIEADWKGCSNDLRTIETKVNEAQVGMEAVQDTLTEAKQELEEKTASINSFRALELEISQKVEEQGKSLKDHNAKFKHWEKRFQELELAEIDEDDDEEEEHTKDAMQVDDEVKQENGDDQAIQPVVRREKQTHQLVEHSDDELQDLNRDVLNAEITQLEEELGKMKPNLNVLAEYRKRENEYLDRAKDLETITFERDQAKQQYDDLRKTRLEEFMVGFSAISSKLKEMYQMITLGGNAELELVDSMDPFSEGIIFSVMPPKKSWKNISNLSGGEKTLSSLALVFALHVFKPTPLYFMDEIDAALDFRNVSIIANYIKSKTEAAQFIIISLRNDMFELSHRLVGIYKTNNCTKSIAIDNKDIRMQARVSASAPQVPTVIAV